MAITGIKPPDVDSLSGIDGAGVILRTFDEYREMVSPYLEEAFNRVLCDSLGSITMRQADTLLSALQAGKKIRGVLTCMICESLGGALESAIPRATAVELIHAATLIHDDFVDQDRTRRNLPAVWTIEGARRAVLIGDVIFATAIETMSLIGRDDGLVVAKTIAEISKGALHEPLDHRLLAQEIESGRTIGGLYEDIIRLKTGILFGTACRLGAIAAQADSVMQEACYKFGLRIGEAYQIADDLQDVKKYLAGEPVRPEQMALLTPALLHFMKDVHPVILGLLNGEKTIIENQSRQPFIASATLMEMEIEGRLKAAVSEIDEAFLRKGFSEMLRATPLQIITMFNRA
jgi:geranylgeranyl pyrophosphate synthase